MTKRARDPFIQFYNVFSESESEFHLKHEELYLYGLLKLYSNIENKTATTISMLHELTPINFLAVEKKSKSRIKQTLLSLKEKGIINFSNDEINSNSILLIEFNEDLSDESVGKGLKGFEQISFNQFNSFRTMADMYIFYTVKRFENLGGFKGSFRRWSRILGTTERRAVTLVNAAVERKVIYKNIGDYKENELGNQKKQDINTYSITPFEAVKKTNMTKSKENKEANEKFRSEIETDDVIEAGIYTFSTYKDEEGNHIYPELADYRLYIEVNKQEEKTKQELNFLKVAEKSFAVILKLKSRLSPNFKLQNKFAVI